MRLSHLQVVLSENVIRLFCGVRNFRKIVTPVIFSKINSFRVIPFLGIAIFKKQFTNSLPN